MRVRLGFTLVELLVVIAIIAVLAAILFPVFASVKSAVRRSQCLSNMRQIGTSLQMYIGDNDGGLPTWNECVVGARVGLGNDLGQSSECTGENVGTALGDGSHYWDAKLIVYVGMGKPGSPASPGSVGPPGVITVTEGNLDRGGVWHCPASPLGSDYRSVGMNESLVCDCQPPIGNVHKPMAYTYISENVIDNPWEKVAIGDGGYGGRLEPPYEWTSFWEDKVAHEPTSHAAPFRHSDSANYAFLDAHARAVPAQTIYPYPTDSSPYPKSAADVPFLLQRAFCAAATYFMPTDDRVQYWSEMARDGGVQCSP